MTGRLHNSFIDVTAVIGADHDTRLTPSNAYKVQSDNVFESYFEHQVLATISSHVCMFPQEEIACDHTYPHGLWQNKPPKKIHFDIIPKNTGVSLSSHGSGRRMTRRGTLALIPSLLRRSSSIGQLSLDHGVGTSADMPISDEALSSLRHFCFPDGFQVYKDNKSSKVHYLVLTDLKGVRTYATCLTMYRQFNITKVLDITEDEGCYELHTTDARTPFSELIYVPCCIVLISQYPYFTVMKDCLSGIAKDLAMQGARNFLYALKPYAFQLATTVVPPSGKLDVQFSLNGVGMIIHPPSSPDKPVVDFPLSLVFHFFGLDAILKIFTSVLTQQRVVFLSADYALITLTMESFLQFILPFKWIGVYVPILSRTMVDFIGAPGFFLMGVHKDHMAKVSETEGLVIVDIDSGSVDVCTSLNIPALPCEAEDNFVNTYKNVIMKSKPHELHCLSRSTPMTLEELRASYLYFEISSNIEIQLLFLDLMVDLFRDVPSFCNPAQSLFKKQQFVEAMDNPIQTDNPDRRSSFFAPITDFYSVVCDTGLFKGFLKNILKERKDYWTERRELSIPKATGILDTIPRQRSRSSPQMSPSSSIVYSKSSKAIGGSVIYKTPDGCSYGKSLSTFYKQIIDEIQHKIQACDETSIRASYYYIVGLVQIAHGNILLGLDTLNNLSANNVRIYPKEIVEKIVSGLSADEKDITSKYKSDVLQKILIKVHQSPSFRDYAIIMNPKSVPDHDVDLHEFQKHIQQGELGLTDSETIERLFKALLISQKFNNHFKRVNKEIFGDFYDYWKENEIQCHSVQLPYGKLEVTEHVLKVTSSLTRTNLGVGTFGLTQKGVFYLTQGSDDFSYYCKLSDISSIEQCTYSSLFGKSDTLKIVKDKSQVDAFVVYLKEDRNLWFLLLNEMFAGKKVADRTREPGIVQQAAQNVLLIDAVIRSGEEDDSRTNLDVAANLLATFTNKPQHCNREEPGCLQHRINPNLKEPEKLTVEALLYTSGRRISGINEEDEIPKLWCGMGKMGMGKIWVFDASSWQLYNTTLQTNDRVLCLLKVGTCVWAGTCDHKIYVIDIQTRDCQQVLEGHNGIVCDMCTSPDESTIYSASLHGEIIVWNAANFTKKSLFSIDSVSVVQYYSGYLWCCTNNKRVISVINPANGIVIASMRYNNIEIDCFLITRTEELWVGLRRDEKIYIWDCKKWIELFKTLQDSEMPKAISEAPVYDITVKGRGVSCMVQVLNKVWVGGKSTNPGAGASEPPCSYINIIDIVSHEVTSARAHEDSIRSLCAADNRYVMTGAGSREGKVAIWKATGT